MVSAAPWTTCLRNMSELNVHQSHQAVDACNQIPYTQCETEIMAKQATTLSLRSHLAELLRMKAAHVSFEAAVADFPATLRGVKPPGAPHSAWQLLEHMRIAQWDILEFSRSAKHVSPDWPEGY